MRQADAPPFYKIDPPFPFIRNMSVFLPLFVILQLVECSHNVFFRCQGLNPQMHGHIRLMVEVSSLGRVDKKLQIMINFD